MKQTQAMPEKKKKKKPHWKGASDENVARSFLIRFSHGVNNGLWGVKWENSWVVQQKNQRPTTMLLAFEGGDAKYSTTRRSQMTRKNENLDNSSQVPEIIWRQRQDVLYFFVLLGASAVV